MFKYIFFDLDGTLTEPKEGITKSVKYALNEFGIDAELDELTPFIGPPLIDSFKKFYGFSDEDADKAVRLYRVRFDKIGKFENKVLPGVPQLLRKLKAQGKILAISSSKPEVFVRQILDKFELSEYFDEIVGSEFDGTRASKTEVVGETFKRLNLNESDKKDIVLVGDRMHDIIGAHEFGIKCAGVRFGYSSENELEEYGADYILETMEELDEFLIH